ncbi:J domain-containing protein [Consotaella salsifontis]|uniref:DnaJ like chaperone protein n=1 Tax=Consotaella salsifontis TaxID=1365950 RepID=A0A1T4MAS0_9HYPH|nr:DnaJ family molecular chaperone [Consotaella salsifontis]SJZ63937.1 DnaJ like chaperone protein [Consotaella salsifontis]
MKALSKLTEILLALPGQGRATLGAVVETVRSVFGGDRQTRRSVAFSIAMIALSAKMAKADGVVTPAEVAAFQQIFHIPADEMRNVFRLYDLAKQDTAGFEAYATRLAGLCEDGEKQCALLSDVLDGLFHIAKADGFVHERELDFLARIAEIFGLDPVDFASLRARHTAGEGQDYAILGVNPAEPVEAVRRRYLALVRENHPDSLIARGVPDEFLAIATERMKAINHAYENIVKARAA